VLSPSRATAGRGHHLAPYSPFNGSDESVRAEEWTSGDILWILKSISETHVMGTRMKARGEREWKGEPVTLITRDEAGRPVVKVVKGGNLSSGTRTGLLKPVKPSTDALVSIYWWVSRIVACAICRYGQPGASVAENGVN
jgi:hypothetical protein